jgi:Protein of unknown function (DUF3604)
MHDSRDAVKLFAALVAAGLVLAPGARAAPLQLLWGDTHLHTSYSVDAYSGGNTLIDPDAAYRYAKGLPVLHPTAHTKIRLDRPLDFLVVSDHAEMLGLQVQLSRQDPAPLATPSGRRLADLLKQNPAAVFREIVRIDKPAESELVRDLHTPAVRATAWSAVAEAADRHNEPGRFTALIGWEWSSAPGGLNLHRVVLTSADATTAKKFLPFSYYDSYRPEDLWRWLAKTEAATGAQFVAIPHNSNLSNGLMFDMVDSDGRPISAEYARERMRWEPVMEVTQVKGTSETHPLLSPTDEQAAFEIRNKLLGGGPATAAEGSYARPSLLRGLQIEARTGANPYKFGLVGGTDSHTGLSSTAEYDFLGTMASDMLPEQRVKSTGTNFRAWEMSASGLAAVWAESNTRQAILDAFRRKEVYATTGTRIALRVFGGFGFRPRDTHERDLAAFGHAHGVPMGGDLKQAPHDRSPALLIQAVKDPLSAPLERVQVIKGWLDGTGKTHEQVFDAVVAGQDGAVELVTLWKDPQFDAAQRAFYYVRVIEKPTPRHQVYDAQALGIDPASTGFPLTIQERAFSSPIWYTP